ncbi:hypothetical protein DY000_02022682 [Brassica cretica]|uniref:Uncharacterized protein n=1 Tax=Brassica cretica TaxID=69181 RepID=A0ABQ7EEK0_BRACR|nr:hypothetical protein DY000_02022682 [Brassica cretica]
MPPVLGQSASSSRSYACSTEEWSLCLARGSCRRDERMSIDGAPIMSIGGDTRKQAKPVS